VTLGPVLDARYYSLSEVEFIPDDTMELYEQGKGWVAEIKEWLFEHFEMHIEGDNADDGLTDISRLRIMSQEYLVQQSAALVVHRWEAAKAKIGGEVEGVTAAKIKSAIEHNFVGDGDFLEQWPNSKLDLSDWVVLCQKCFKSGLSYSFPEPPQECQFVMVQVEGI